MFLSCAFDSPAATITEALTTEPKHEEVVVGAVSSSLYVPGGGRGGPALVLLNGATERGRGHPRVVRVARALARTGHVVLVPDLPGVDRGEVTLAGVEAAVACCLEVASRSRDIGGVALIGVSVGTPIALLAAERPQLAGRVRVVAGLTGYTDLVDLIRLATTGTYREGGLLRRHPPEPFLALCVARSVCASLDPGPDRSRMAGVLDVPHDDPDPLAQLRQLQLEEVGEQARGSLALLLNREPDRFDELYEALPSRARRTIEELSPLTLADRLDAPVELLVDPADKYFPLEHARALARAVPTVRITTTGALAHTDTRFSIRRVPDALSVLEFGARTIGRARFG
jgi:pimeloyl-ACP methyl ester carboxylesterase